MPKPLVKGREEADPSLPPPPPPAPAAPEAGHPRTSAEVSLILALYRRCVEGGYQNCDVLRQMAVDAIKKRLRSVVEAELAGLATAELREKIGQICVEV